LTPADPDQSFREVKTNNRSGAPVRGNFEDRPITPLRGTYKQVADQFADEDNPQYNDNRSNDRSPTRNKESKYQRTLSASQRSINSMSQTIDPHHRANHHQELKNMSPARTLGSATRTRTSNNPSMDDGKFHLNQTNKIQLFNILDSTRLKDNPNRDAFGPMAKESKINNMRKYENIFVL
jgi:hypothetical protein